MSVDPNEITYEIPYCIFNGLELIFIISAQRLNYRSIIRQKKRGFWLIPGAFRPHQTFSSGVGSHFMRIMK